MDATSAIITSFQTIPIGAGELKWIKIDQPLVDELSNMHMKALYESSLSKSASTYNQSKSAFRELGIYSLSHKNNIICWAMLTLHQAKFERLIIYIPNMCPQEHEIAIDYLISACFLNFNPDEIRLVSSLSYDKLSTTKSQILCLNTYKLKSVKLKDSYTNTYLSYEISRQQWRDSKLYNQCYEDLRHLEQRRLRLIREHTCCQGRTHKKRSFIARLFRPTIDDPLF